MYGNEHSGSIKDDVRGLVKLVLGSTEMTLLLADWKSSSQESHYIKL